MLSKNDLIFILSTHPIVLQNGLLWRNVEGSFSRSEFPHKVIARLDNCLRLADVLGTLLLRMQLIAPGKG